MASDNLGEIQEIQLSWWKNFIQVSSALFFCCSHFSYCSITIKKNRGILSVQFYYIITDLQLQLLSAKTFLYSKLLKNIYINHIFLFLKIKKKSTYHTNAATALERVHYVNSTVRVITLAVIVLFFFSAALASGFKKFVKSCSNF